MLETNLQRLIIINDLGKGLNSWRRVVIDFRHQTKIISGGCWIISSYEVKCKPWIWCITTERGKINIDHVKTCTMYKEQTCERSEVSTPMDEII